MKLFRHSSGFIIAFGFNMLKRKEDNPMIAWSDPSTEEWEPSPTNMAGCLRMPFAVDPEFVFEQNGRVVAYQPGKCIEMTLTGTPMVWRFCILQSDKQISEAA